MWKNSCHRVSVPWDSSFISEQHCPRLYKCCELSNARVWNQSVSLNLGPLRFHQLSSTTSLAPDLPNFSPLSNSRGQVEMLCWKKIQLFFIFLPLVMVELILFVSNNLITLLLLFKLRIWIVEKYCARHLPAQILLIVGFQPPGQNATPFVFEVTWSDHKMKFSSSADWYCFKHEKIFETERTYCVCMKPYVVCTIYTIYSATQ